MTNFIDRNQEAMLACGSLQRVEAIDAMMLKALQAAYNEIEQQLEEEDMEDSKAFRLSRLYDKLGVALRKTQS